MIRMVYGKTSFLFTGDAEDVSEQEMISKGFNLKSDVLKVGHHGSANSMTEHFLKKVNPKYAIICVGNKQRGIVEIKLDKVRNLRFTLNALAEIEDKLGVSVNELDKVSLGLKTVRTFLWAGLIHEDKTFTEENVGDMVDFENMEYVQTKIAEAFELANRKNG